MFHVKHYTIRGDDKMIKIFVTDMDHTFLDEESNLPLETQNIIDRLEQEERMFIVASGRTLTNLENKFKDYDHSLTFIADNGGILKHKGEILHIEILDEDVVVDTINQFKKAKDSVTVVIKADMAYIEDDRADYKDYIDEFYTNLTVVDNLLDYTKNVVKITGLSFTSSQDNFNNYINGKLDESVYPIEAGARWIDVMNKGVNKAKALEVIMNKYDISSDHVVSFGDYFNDLELIQNVKYGYVVENGVEGLKKHAYEVIGKNTDNAVINKILEHLDK